MDNQPARTAAPCGAGWLRGNIHAIESEDVLRHDSPAKYAWCAEGS